MSPVPHKITSLQRCVARAREARATAGTTFPNDSNLQDAAVLNIIRACNLAIDLANMLIRKRRLGIPTESVDSIRILMRERVIPPELFERLQGMVGFRNLAVHQYQEINLAIVEAILDKDLDDLLAFAETLRPLLDDA